MKNKLDLLIDTLIDRVENGSIDRFLYTIPTSDSRFGITYHFGIGLKVSKEMIDDIKSNPSDWRQMQKELEDE